MPLVFEKEFWVCLVPPFYPKNFRFWPSILQNETKHHAINFGKKIFILHFGFWPQEAKKSQKAKKLSPTP
jgi:hypothetical protein